VGSTNTNLAGERILAKERDQQTGREGCRDAPQGGEEKKGRGLVQVVGAQNSLCDYGPAIQEEGSSEGVEDLTRGRHG